MRVLTFQPQFHALIRSGQKTSTIRDTARCKPGDELSLRRWQGRPYATKQEQLISNQICAAVTPVRMWVTPAGAFVMAKVVRREGRGYLETLASSAGVSVEAREIAGREGFHDFDVMKEWFINAKKLRPFVTYKGDMIEWDYSKIPA